MSPTNTLYSTDSTEKNKERRELAAHLATHDTCLWTDEDVTLLLLELEIEIGEGTNRFIYDDERMSYCNYLSQTAFSHQAKTPKDILDKIVWLWTTWEAISKATDQQLISMFKYYNECDRIFAYIKEDEGEVDDEFLFDEGSSIYY
ncbi:hypothetical protein RMCBS344292_04340 [Rhizopus microsporus]|nr:hypothetical protein RMCBS344292_04340 [Rhizopus microsporus]